MWLGPFTITESLDLVLYGYRHWKVSLRPIQWTYNSSKNTLFKLSVCLSVHRCVSFDWNFLVYLIFYCIFILLCFFHKAWYWHSKWLQLVIGSSSRFITKKFQVGYVRKPLVDLFPNSVFIGIQSKIYANSLKLSLSFLESISLLTLIMMIEPLGVVL